MGIPTETNPLAYECLKTKASNEIPAIDLRYLGITRPVALHNVAPAQLTEEALINNEGILSDRGALSVKTGAYTGRSPKDRFIVDDPLIHDSIAWGSTNVPMTPDVFESLWSKAIEYVNTKEKVYVFDGLAGADRAHAKRFRVINESAAQNLFIHQLLVRPTKEECDAFGRGDFTLISCPGLSFDAQVDQTHSSAVVALDIVRQRILVAGTGYSGEIKKAIFTTMNYLMPDEGVLPMHCSANCCLESGSTAIFFGLSGTGKTTLSADPDRAIVGDDEHGWSDTGVFNFEGGCYAKCIDLTEESEPEIYRAIRFGSIMENVVLDPLTREPDFSDGSITDNTRVSYPVNYIPNAIKEGVAPTPNVVIFLTADAFGVLPPISRLSPEAAMYHFVTGFTSKVAGTECGITDPVPTFSSMFGEPFMPRPASVYAEMLGACLALGKTQVYLVNTGWAGGSASCGASRIPLRYTRAMVAAALSGDLVDASYVHDDVFGVDVPLAVEGVPSELLDPRTYWQAKGHTAHEYDVAADALAVLFQDNFAAKHASMDATIANAGPKPRGV